MNNKQKADGTTDLEERLNNYITEERSKAITCVATEEDLNVDILNHYLSEYDYLQRSSLKLFKKR